MRPKELSFRFFVEFPLVEAFGSPSCKFSIGGAKIETSSKLNRNSNILCNILNYVNFVHLKISESRSPHRDRIINLIRFSKS